jgi:hypothetical protein
VILKELSKNRGTEFDYWIKVLRQAAEIYNIVLPDDLELKQLYNEEKTIQNVLEVFR